MFEKARLKLTAWYLLIIMCISVLFSIAIYTGINRELFRIESMQKTRQERLERRFRDLAIPPPKQPNTREIQDARERLILVLLGINFGILAVSGGAGYFLAGRTLRPIKEMVDEQNRFITDASHELRTPITVLRSELEVALRNKAITVKEAHALLESNLEEVKNIQALSDKLLELAQFEKPYQATLFSHVYLSLTISSAIKKLDTLILKKDITVKNNITKTIQILGEEQSLQELFTILLDNAIKYSPTKSTITLESRIEKNVVSIFVKDQGIGIEEKDIPYIFDRFYRAHASRTNQNIPGYGLGLSIAQKIVALHKGSIEVKSALDKGSTFIIQFPLKHS